MGPKGGTNLSIRALLNKLSRNLTILKDTIAFENPVGNFETNLFSETVVLKLLNIQDNWQLQNANLIEKNYPGIDGADDANKVMVQVTSTFSNDKIDHTIDNVLKKSLYERYTRLIFIFLKDKKPLGKIFVGKLLEKIGNRFVFDPVNDCKDLTDIYRYHYLTQNIEKLHQAVRVLEESFDLGGGFSGYDSFSVCFHDEELANVFLLVEAIIKEGINVYTCSKKLFEEFAKRSHPLQEFIVYSPSFQSMDHIGFSIVVLSNAFINQLLRSKYTCELFHHAIENDIKIEFLSFDPGLRDFGKVSHPRIRGYRQLTASNISKSVKEILADRLRSVALTNISPGEIRQELVSLHSNFKPTDIIKEAKFILLNFQMPKFQDIELNYLILGPKAVPNSVETMITKLPKSLKNLIVLIPKDFYQKTRRRLKTAQSIFNTELVYYVDEYLYDNVIKDIPRQPLLNTDDFVPPMINFNGQHVGINSITHWIFSNTDSVVAIITGSGGIGKTTVCEKVHDTIVKDDERIIAIFIDASKYIEVFRRQGGDDSTEYDLYNIFKECYPHANLIDRNSFYLNYSLGNLIIIFDGIDEILSTIPSFNLRKFLKNLENVRASIGRGKILINCRDSYVSELRDLYRDKDSHLQIYELLGFSDEQARTFFEKTAFGERSVNLCMKMVREIYSQSTDVEFKYPPFILQVVNQVVSSDFAYDEINMDFESSILEKTDNNDVVVYRICAREYAKKNRNGFQLEVDDQIRFLCEMAIEEKGKIKENDFARILENIGKRDRIDDVVKGLIDHPLLQKSNGDHIFRYDFFNIYFKSVAIFNMLCSEMSHRLTERLINILAYDCNFNSVLSKVLILKASNSTIKFSDCLRYSKKLISEISAFALPNNSVNLTRKRKAMSNVLVIILASKPSKISNEQILDFLYGNDNSVIRGFCFSDVPYYANISFDFSNKIFTEANIVNYGRFFSCVFSNTFFDDTCNISNVYSNMINLRTITARVEHFDKKITGDNSIFRVMNIRNNENEVKRFFRAYFQAFYKNKQFQYDVAVTSISIPSDSVATVERITGILLRHNILDKTENKKVYLSRKLKFGIIHFLDEGMIFNQLNKSISELRNWLLFPSGSDDDPMPAGD